MSGTRHAANRPIVGCHLKSLGPTPVATAGSPACSGHSDRPQFSAVLRAVGWTSFSEQRSKAICRDGAPDETPLHFRRPRSCRRTGWPWVIAHPGLPQTRTCGHYRIRFLKSWVHCMTKLGAHCAGRSQRVTAKQGAEFLPVHRADVVAAIQPLTPSILDFLAEPVHRF